MRAWGSSRSGRARLAGVAVALAVGLLVGCTPRIDVYYLSNETGGRNNNTAGSTLARNWIAGHLDNMGAEPIRPAERWPDRYGQPIPLGTNVIGIIPGTDLADEYVIVGAHYDHVGSCPTSDPSDTICNGATDNATGVAAVLEIGRRLTAAEVPPRRSVVLALWDREEDSLLGSQHYVQNPVVPLADTVAYVNFDILGANLLPSLRSTTFAIGAESGGSAFQDLVAGAAAPQSLDVAQLGWIFGQGRSDYFNFRQVQVPNVFFSDSTGPCYHTAQDEPEIVDFDKLDEQIAIGLEVTRGLTSGEVTPAWDGATPLATYDDLVAFDALMDRAAIDSDLLTPADAAAVASIAATTQTLVDDGAAAFGADDVTTLLSNAVAAVEILTHGECDGFLPE